MFTMIRTNDDIPAETNMVFPLTVSSPRVFRGHRRYSLYEKLQMVKNVYWFVSVVWMHISKECEVCGINHKLYLDEKKNVDKYQVAVKDRESIILFVVAGKSHYY